MDAGSGGMECGLGNIAMGQIAMPAEPVWKSALCGSQVSCPWPCTPVNEKTGMSRRGLCK